MSEETLIDVFENSNEEGRLDMFEEAVDNIHQLNGFIKEKNAEISELRRALVRKDEEIAALLNRIGEMETQYMELLTESQLRNPKTETISEAEYIFS